MYSKSKLGIFTLFGVCIGSLVFMNVESRQSVRRLVDARLEDSIVSSVTQNESNVRDWASWDETVKLALSEHHTYFEDNFNQDTSEVVQFVLAVDRQGRHSGILWNSVSESYESLDSLWLQAIGSQRMLRCGETITFFGLDEPYLLSSSAITATNAADGRSFGCLYFGKRHPGLELQRIIRALVSDPSLHIQSISFAKPDVTESNEYDSFGFSVQIQRNYNYYFWYLLPLGSLVLILCLCPFNRRRGQ